MRNNFKQQPGLVMKNNQFFQIFWWLALAIGMLPGRALAEIKSEVVLDGQSGHPLRINGPSIFGVHPKSPFLYTIPVVGERPVRFGVDNLPVGLQLDIVTGQITGALISKGEYRVVLHVTNNFGCAEKPFRIVVGDRIALTPIMGWNSWNCWGQSVDQEKMLRSAHAMVASGLINHGWTYINIDDTWQGRRTGPDRALQANEKFPDLKGFCDELHRLGLKAGIYSTPWVAAYSKYPGGSSDSPNGFWVPDMAIEANHRFGKYSFAQADARQWAVWGFDYLKYDWAVMDVPHAKEMSEALRKSGRDIVFSLSNTAPFDRAADWAQWANSWRTTCDIMDHWDACAESWQFGVSQIGFAQDQWASFAGPGHWNDPDMLVVGRVGCGELISTNLTAGQLHPSHLTPEEQYSHISMWCLLSAPLLIGCDLEQLDAFTINLLSNDEVLSLDQDALGKQATRVATFGPVDVYLKELEDGARAVGFFNRDSNEQTIAFDKLGYLGFKSIQHVRDLWLQKDLSDWHPGQNENLIMRIPAHGVKLYKLTGAETK